MKFTSDDVCARVLTKRSAPASAFALLVSCALVFAATGCKRTEDAPVPAPPIPSREPPPVPPVAAAEPLETPSEESVKACRDGLARGLKAVEAVHPTRRLVPALKAVGESCEAVLGRSLAASAQEALTLGMPRRAGALAKGAQSVLPPTCVASEPAGAALEVSYACPPPEAFALAEPLLRDLDAGTYVFALAARERLAKAKALDADAERLLGNLVLAGALEGEARRTAAGGGAK